MVRPFAAVALLAALAGCETSSATCTAYRFDARFDAAEAAAINAPGTAQILGAGGVQTADGAGAQTCAGQTVTLYVSTDYARKALAAAAFGYDIGPDQGLAQLQGATRQTVCDPTGRFVFDKLPTGRFLAVTHLAGATGEPWQTMLVADLWTEDRKATPAMLDERAQLWNWAALNGVERQDAYCLRPGLPPGTR